MVDILREIGKKRLLRFQCQKVMPQYVIQESGTSDTASMALQHV